MTGWHILKSLLIQRILLCLSYKFQGTLSQLTEAKSISGRLGACWPGNRTLSHGDREAGGVMGTVIAGSGSFQVYLKEYQSGELQLPSALAQSWQ